MYNKITLIGNLGADAEIKQFENGNVQISFSIATSKKWKDKNTGEWKEKSTWHNIRKYGTNLDYLKERLVKGCRVFIEGEQLHDKYEKDGETKYFANVKAEIIKFLDKNENADDGGYDNVSYNNAPKQAPKADYETPPEIKDEFEKEDVPF